MSLLYYLVFVATIIQIFVPAVCFVLLIFLIEWTVKKFHFSYRNIFIILLVLASSFGGIYKWSWNFSGLSAAVAFDGYDIEDDLVTEFWSQFYVYPFVQKSCYIQNPEKCAFWSKHLGPYKIYSNYRFSAYVSALIFGLFSGGTTLVISKFINSLFSEAVDSDALSS